MENVDISMMLMNAGFSAEQVAQLDVIAQNPEHLKAFYNSFIPGIIGQGISAGVNPTSTHLKAFVELMENPELIDPRILFAVMFSQRPQVEINPSIPVGDDLPPPYAP